MNALITLTITALCLLGATACSGRGAAATSSAAGQDSAAAVETFSADSAYAFVAEQVAFGPRVPGSDAHRACRDRLVECLSEWADTVTVMGEPVTAWDGTVIPVHNIFARFNGNSSKGRILLLAHYDTRPWADHDPDPAQRLTPIDGANDGASGVAVLLEIARNLANSRPDIGVDILLTDAEDYGAREDAGVSDSDGTWCLGAQQFAANLPYTAADMPSQGILLDMVGGRGAKFHMEYFSTRHAQAPTARIWATAARLGLAGRFPAKAGGAINDDHLPLIRAGIPTVDIIENANASTGSFPPTWHTHQDNLENIDPAALGDVGRVVLNYIYSCKP